MQSTGDVGRGKESRKLVYCCSTRDKIVGLGLEKKEQGQEERKGEGGRRRRSALKTF